MGRSEVIWSPDTVLGCSPLAFDKCTPPAFGHLLKPMGGVLALRVDNLVVAFALFGKFLRKTEIICRYRQEMYIFAENLQRKLADKDRVWSIFQ